MWETLTLWFDNHPNLIAWSAAISVLTFLGTLIAVPIAIITMRADFFLRTKANPTSLTPLRLLAKAAKNGLGLVLIAMGFVMLFIPGQGLLTILLGITLTDFPGKRRLELALVQRPHIHRSINWIRHRAHRPPVKVPPERPAEPD